MLGRRVLVSVVALGSVSLWSLSASADETADFCSEEELSCMEAPVAFSKEVVLPFQGGFDTGFIPANSPIQVHLFAQLWANSRVDMAGHLRTTWPETLTFEVPPEPGTGSMSIHYGVDIGAEAHIEFTVLGQTFDWTGDIPYVPQFDFQVEAADTFDPWAFEGVSIDGSTMMATIAQVSVGSFLPLDIPGLDGGFELDTYIELTATYRTSRIEVTTLADQSLVEGGAITAEEQSTSDTYGGDAGVDYQVRPVGEIVYDGVLHLVPAFYIETIGPDFTIPIADYPIPFQFTQRDWEFDPATVHVPFPDIALADELGGPAPADQDLVLDLGEVEIGDSASGLVSLGNTGEALLAGAASIESESDFTLTGAAVVIEPDAGMSLTVSFTASQAGEATGSLVIESNDPDEPARTVLLRAHVTEAPIENPDDDDDDGDADGEDDDMYVEGGGCSCRTADDPSMNSGWAALAFAGALGAFARRRRR